MCFTYHSSVSVSSVLLQFICLCFLTCYDEMHMPVMPQYEEDSKCKIQDILLSFCAYNYTHIRLVMQKVYNNIIYTSIQYKHKNYKLYKLNCKKTNIQYSVTLYS